MAAEAPAAAVAAAVPSGGGPSADGAGAAGGVGAGAEDGTLPVGAQSIGAGSIGAAAGLNARSTAASRTRLTGRRSDRSEQAAAARPTSPQAAGPAGETPPPGSRLAVSDGPSGNEHAGAANSCRRSQRRRLSPASAAPPAHPPPARRTPAARVAPPRRPAQGARRPSLARHGAAPALAGPRGRPTRPRPALHVVEGAEEE